MTNKEYREKLIEEYSPVCFGGGVVCSKNILTLHHTKPKRDGTPVHYKYLVLLCQLEHTMFNILEKDDPLAGKWLNECFLYYKHTFDEMARMGTNIYMHERICDMEYEIIDNGKIYTLKKRG